MAKRIRIVIPDAGVLISLAAGGLLDLMMTFRPGVQVVISDVVEYEVTRRTDTASAMTIRSFLSKYAGHILVDKTSYGELLSSARKYTDIRLPEDLGETSIYSYIGTIKTWNPGDPTLVLFEDSWFIENDVAKPANAHLLSTMAFLEGLEQLVPEFSADKAMKAICSMRPYFNKVHHDVPSRVISGGTDWKNAVDISKVKHVAKRLKPGKH